MPSHLFQIDIGPEHPDRSFRNAYVGGRYIGYRTNDTGRIGLQRCPACQSENYALAVHDGVCCWCGWDANCGAEIRLPTQSSGGTER